MLLQSGKSAGVLLVAGFLGGFSLSSSAVHFLRPSMPTTQASAGGGGKRGGMASEGGESRVSGSAHDQEGSSGAGAGTASNGSGGGGGDVAKPAEATPEPTPDLLSGNTLMAEDGTRFRYLSRRGWQGEGDRNHPDDLTVTRWTSHAGALCRVSVHAGLACIGTTIAPESKPDPKQGAKLGVLTTVAGDHWTILRGNAENLPDAMPLIMGELPRQEAKPSKKPKTVGMGAVEELTSRTLRLGGPSASPMGVRYEADGRWTTAVPLLPDDKTGTDGVKVTIGHWLFTAETFCLDKPGLTLDRSCFAPEQWGDDTFRLVSTRTAAVTTLLGTQGGS